VGLKNYVIKIRMANTFVEIVEIRKRKRKYQIIGIKLKKK